MGDTWDPLNHHPSPLSPLNLHYSPPFPLNSILSYPHQKSTDGADILLKGEVKMH